MIERLQRRRTGILSTILEENVAENGEHAEPEKRLHPEAALQGQWRLGIAHHILAVEAECSGTRRWFSSKYAGLEDTDDKVHDVIQQRIKERKRLLHPDKTRHFFDNQEDIATCTEALKILNDLTDKMAEGGPWVPSNASASASAASGLRKASVHPRGGGPTETRPRPEGPVEAYVWDPYEQDWRCRVCKGGGQQGKICTLGHLTSKDHLKRINDPSGYYLRGSCVPCEL